MRRVDCMACLTVGVSMPMGIVDGSGIVHYVRWAVAHRYGCFKLCDFENESLSRDRNQVDVSRLIPTEEP